MDLINELVSQFNRLLPAGSGKAWVNCEISNKNPVVDRLSDLLEFNSLSNKIISAYSKTFLNDAIF